MELNPREEKKQTIIKAAIEVFSNKGYHSARMEEIAAAAGIGKGTVYEYFTSKVELLHAVLESSFEIYFRSLTPGERDNLSFEARLHLLVEGHIRFCQENKQLTRIVFWDAEIFDEELKEYANSIRKEKENHMIEIVEAAIQRGEIKPVNPRLVTLMVGGILGSIWAPITLDDWEEDPAALAHQITELVIDGIRPTPSV